MAGAGWAGALGVTGSDMVDAMCWNGKRDSSTVDPRKSLTKEKPAGRFTDECALVSCCGSLIDAFKKF